MDVKAIRAKWLRQCAPCDAGLPGPCTHPGDDPRSVILDLVRHIEFLESKVKLMQSGVLSYSPAMSAEDPLEVGRHGTSYYGPTGPVDCVVDIRKHT